MNNTGARLKKLLPDPPLLIGEVTSMDGGVATIELPGGGFATARGAATPGQKVFFRNGAIEGEAPDLPSGVIEI